MSTQLEHLWRVHIDCHYIEIGEWPDSPDRIELRTTGQNAGYFGPLNLALDPKDAKAIGEALIKAAAMKGIA